ncbi:carbon starvation CstA family protein [Escherichia coli]|uniref:carbon starvation CstA family protein n=1 Tax=Escherichia coli TaxID=562 RepID=UPI0037C01D27
MNKSGKYLVWTVLSVMGAFALGYIALNRGEQINALWIVVASVCIYLIAYRFYGLYIAKNVLAVDPTRMTPAVRHNDGLDYVPTDKKVLFGHHFAAIAGAGPLVGPVLAAQMGYLPGMIWLLAGVVLAGAVQDLLGVVSPGLKRTDSLPANLLATALCVLAWGYFLHQGVVDPLGGINTLWPLFGIANQMLAGMALMLCAVVLFKMKRQRYAWVALVPTAWLLICTLTAGWQKAFSPDAKVGFLAIANKFQAMIDSGNIPSQYTESQLAQLVFNNRLDAGLTIFFMVVVVVLALFSIKTALAALKEPKPTAKETPYEPMPENVEEIVAQAKGAH